MSCDLEMNSMKLCLTVLRCYSITSAFSFTERWRGDTVTSNRASEGPKKDRQTLKCLVEFRSGAVKRDATLIACIKTCDG